MSQIITVVNDHLVNEGIYNLLFQLSFDYVESQYDKMLDSYFAFEKRLVAFGLDVIKEMLESVIDIFY